MALDAQLPGTPTDAKGDLPKLYKAVARKLNLDPNKHDAESIKSVLRGLVGVVQGLASLRNSMGDAHPRQYKPSRHHAQLAVNAAKTIIDFITKTYAYQYTASQLHKGF